MRLAGLYSLERLAQDIPALRQTIVNLMCAYLCMPASEPRLQGNEVRRTAQRILAKHLQPGADPGHPAETFWPDIDLDLTGAEPHLFDLKGARLRDGWFGGAAFVGRARFDDVRFDGEAKFGGATFERSVSLRATRFRGEARFRGAVFSGAAHVDGASFAGEALFGGRQRRSDGGDPTTPGSRLPPRSRTPPSPGRPSSTTCGPTPR